LGNVSPKTASMYSIDVMNKIKTQAPLSAIAPPYKSSSRGRELLVTLISVLILIAQLALTAHYIEIQWSKDHLVVRWLGKDQTTAIIKE